MVQMILPWWPRITSCDSETVATATRSKSEMNETEYHHHRGRCCLSKLMRKLRRQSRTMLQCRSIVGSRKVQCKGTGYDPLSYSLNFDDSRRGCSGGADNGLSDEEDYYRFCTFTSRFVNATGVPSTTTPKVVLVTTSH